MQRLLFVFIYLACACCGQSQNLDERIVTHINGNGTAFKDGFFKPASFSVYPVSAGLPAMQLATGIIRRDKQLRTDALWSSGVFAANFLFTRVVKVTVNRKRPFETLPDIVKRSSTPNGHSFFSGHASTAFCTAAWLALHYKKWYVAAPALLWAGTVSYARMYQGVHYPSDVVTGAVVGTGIAWAGYKVQQRILNKKRPATTAMRY